MSERAQARLTALRAALAKDSAPVEPVRWPVGRAIRRGGGAKWRTKRVAPQAVREPGAPLW
jgi:hypothetical protein